MASGVLSPGVLPAFVLAAAAVLALSGCSVTVDVGDGQERIETQLIPLDGVTAIDVATDNGRVEVRGGDVDTIQVETIFNEHETGDGTSETQVVGGSLELSGSCDGSWFEQCSVGYRVTVPHDLAVAVRTDNGEIELGSLAGPVEAATDNGSIEAVDLRSGDIDLFTDNGTIDVTVPSGELTYAVDAGSDNGDVDVTVTTDPSSDRRIDAHSDNGSIEIHPAS